MPSPLGPLRFRRHFVEKVWGGRALERAPGIQLPPDVSVGETWELVDRRAENSVVDVGPLRGTTLRELMEARATELLGDAAPGRAGRFPLLVKYLDARDDLSVQVHPDDEAAARLGGGAEGKTEAWYVLAAAPGARLYTGPRAEVDRARFSAAVAAGGDVLDALASHPVEAGDALLVPGGTVHAIGRGVTILEVQQNSDTTFRLWDWGRLGLDGKPRETHVEQALACARFGAEPARPAAGEYVAEGDGLERARLVRSDYFGMDALRVAGEHRFSTSGRFRLLVSLGGAGRLSAGGEEYELGSGDVWLLPAARGEYVLSSPAGSRYLEVFPGPAAGG